MSTSQISQPGYDRDAFDALADEAVALGLARPSAGTLAAARAVWALVRPDDISRPTGLTEGEALMLARAALNHFAPVNTVGADGGVDAPVLRVTMSVYPDRTVGHLEFCNRVRFGSGSNAVRAAITALEAEYAARLRCPAAPKDAAPEPATGELSQAARDVLAERRRQIEVEGWASSHDDAHVNQELAYAAACYAGPVWATAEAKEAGEPPIGWPWPRERWKPTTHRRNLVKSTALAIAEIERLDRAAPPATPADAKGGR